MTEWAHLWRRNGLAPWRLCRVTLQPYLLKTQGACNFSLLHFWIMQSSLGRWERSRSGGDGNSSGTTEEPADDLVLALFVLCRVSSVKFWQITTNSILLLSCTHTFRLYHHRIRRHSSERLLTTHIANCKSRAHVFFFSCGGWICQLHSKINKRCSKGDQLCVVCCLGIHAADTVGSPIYTLRYTWRPRQCDLPPSRCSKRGIESQYCAVAFAKLWRHWHPGK